MWRNAVLCCLLALAHMATSLNAGDRVGPNGMFTIISALNNNHNQQHPTNVAVLERSRSTLPPATTSFIEIGVNTKMVEEGEELQETELWERPLKMKYYFHDESPDAVERGDKLGSGTFGTVYEAQVKINGEMETVVLKRFPLPLDADTATADAMKRELYIHGIATDENDQQIARCVKPPVESEDSKGCWVFQQDELKETVTYLVLVKYDSDLKKWMENSPTRTSGEILQILEDIVVGVVNLGNLPQQPGISAPCETLPCAWVHLDIKSENILMKGGRAFVHDFGLVEFVRAQNEASSKCARVKMSDDKSPLIKAAVSWGYRAPELICSSAATTAAQWKRPVSDYMDSCEVAFASLTKVNNDFHLKYDDGTGILLPYHSTDVFAIGMILLRLLGITFVQTTRDLRTSIPYIFARITARSDEVQTARVHYLLHSLRDSSMKPTGSQSNIVTTKSTKPSPSGGPNKQSTELLCLASLMTETDPSRRPSYENILQLVQSILALERSKSVDDPRLRSDIPFVANFIRSCHDAVSSWS